MARRQDRAHAVKQRRAAGARPASVRVRGARAAADAAATPTVIYVHGLGRQPAAAQLKLDWDLALFGRDMGDRTRMAYWADLREAGAAGPSGRGRAAARRGRSSTSRAAPM